MADQDQKPNLNEDKPEHVNIRVVAQDGTTVQFKIKKRAQLRKLMTTYCARQGFAENSVVFLYDGRRVLSEQTPEDLDMEEDDNQIDVMVAQEGGYEG